jgi:hypothetical protein
MLVRTSCLIFSMLIWFTGPALAQDRERAQTQLTITISAPMTTVKAGAAVPLRLTLTNTSDSPLGVQAFGVEAPPYGVVRLRDLDIQIRDSDGKPVAETQFGKLIHGRYVPPREVKPDHSRPLRPGPGGSRALASVIEPGQTLIEESDLAKEFDLSMPGEYTVQGMRRDKAGKLVESNVIRLTITP